MHLALFCRSQFSTLKSGKNMPTSRTTDSSESEPWHAFLVSDMPNCPRMLSGCVKMVLNTLVGPIIVRQRCIASSPANTKTSIGPLQRKFVDNHMTSLDYIRVCYQYDIGRTTTENNTQLPAHERIQSIEEEFFRMLLIKPWYHLFIQLYFCIAYNSKIVIAYNLFDGR